MAEDTEGEDRFDGLLLRLAEEHKDGGIKEVKQPHQYTRRLQTPRGCASFGVGHTCLVSTASAHFLWVSAEEN